MIKEKHTKEMSENIPTIDLRIIKGNHFIAHKKPKAFNNVFNKDIKKSKTQIIGSL